MPVVKVVSPPPAILSQQSITALEKDCKAGHKEVCDDIVKKNKADKKQM